ncbi:hypothetical protein [Clostridium rectalis]|uniref:hypothetical protein n=1 Tax=Clostridium rectalis TaxID=2040295 RepID=UPI001FA94EC2|nr:hypothetical protein [Clostridium rectalis]
MTLIINIKKLTLDKTVIVIAHRLNTIKDAEQIIILNEGAVEEYGNHAKLILNKKRY